MFIDSRHGQVESTAGAIKLKAVQGTSDMDESTKYRGNGIDKKGRSANFVSNEATAASSTNSDCVNALYLRQLELFKDDNDSMGRSV